MVALMAVLRVARKVAPLDQLSVVQLDNVWVVPLVVYLVVMKGQLKADQKDEKTAVPMVERMAVLWVEMLDSK